MFNIFLILIVSLCWSLPYFLIKDLTKYLSTIEIMVISHLVWDIFILSYIGYIWIFNRPKATSFINNIKKLPNKYKYYILSLTIIGIISQISYFTLLKNNNVSIIIPILNGLSNIFIILLAYYLFKEELTLTKFMGILLVILGIYLIN
jgi:drug/metabolite transporter (DMT)-like permease